MHGGRCMATPSQETGATSSRPQRQSYLRASMKRTCRRPPAASASICAGQASRVQHMVGFMAWARDVIGTHALLQPKHAPAGAV
jgi:hypothetical protein